MSWSPTAITDLAPGSASPNQVLKNDGAGGTSWDDIEGARTSIAIEEILRGDGSNGLSAMLGGLVVQVKYATSLTEKTNALNLIDDDTDILATESSGAGLSINFTPKFTDSDIIYLGTVTLGASVASHVILGWRFDTGSVIEAVQRGLVGGIGAAFPMFVMMKKDSWGLTEKPCGLQFGGVSGTTYTNRIGSGGRFNNAMASHILVIEVYQGTD